MARIHFIVQHNATEIRGALTVEAPDLEQCWRLSPIQLIREFAGAPCDPPACPSYHSADGDVWSIKELIETPDDNS